jgi:nucleoside-diphosphate-sugar epimerase/predicted acylesterase/phospholipase RssA
MGRPVRIGLALQGGGAHAAFAWGVLDRLLEEVEAGRLEITAISGTSAGALNAAALALGLAHSADAARRSLRRLWECIADEARPFNPFVVASSLDRIERGERWNVDNKFVAQILERFRISPYDLPGYSNPLVPVIERALRDLGPLQVEGEPHLFVCATRIRDNQQVTFTRPRITADVLLASACEPLLFQAIEIDGERYWDGGYMGNPSLVPLIDVDGVDDIIVVEINPINRTDGLPRSFSEITDRLNEITFNTSLMHELTTIHTVNKLLEQSPPGAASHRNYRPIRLHKISNEPFMQTLGVVSKHNPYWPFLEKLFLVGRDTADLWLAQHGKSIGEKSTLNVEEDIKPVLRQEKVRVSVASDRSNFLATPNPRRNKMAPSNNSQPVLITGGTGFIGSYLARELARRGEEVVLFDRNPDMIRIANFADYQNFKDRLTFVQGDLTLLPHVMEVFDNHLPRSVYHLGALLSAGGEANPTMGFQVDLLGTWHVLEAARLHHESKKTNARTKVIFPSTIAAFGAHLPKDKSGEKLPVGNEAVQIPETIYGVAKVASERLGEYYNRKGWVDFRALRFPSVIGAGRGPGGTTVYSTLMVELPATGKDYYVYVGDGVRVAIIYVKDAVKGLIELHDTSDAGFGSWDGSTKEDTRVFNLRGIAGSDGRPPTAREIADAVDLALKNDPNAGKVIFNAGDVDSGIEKKLKSFGFLDETRARKEWDWQGDFTDLGAAVADFVGEVKKHPKRLKKIELYG